MSTNADLLVCFATKVLLVLHVYAERDPCKRSILLDNLRLADTESHALRRYRCFWIVGWCWYGARHGRLAGFT